MKNIIFATSTKFYFMKKFLSLILLVILSFNVKAQTSLTEAVDFTGTDCYGEEVINLFEILDRGQHVLIDFFFQSCTPCQRVVPYVIEAYEAFGCNNHDVFFMEISVYDKDFICQYWAEKYGVQYPTISIEGGGVDIQNIYLPPGTGVGYPTFVLIAPDRKILLQDMDYDSIKAREAQYIIEQLEQFGIKQNSCEALPIPEKPVISAEATSDTTIVVTWNAVENASSYTLYQGIDTIAQNVTDTTYTVTGLSGKTEYCFTLTASNIAGESEMSDELCVKTLSGEGFNEIASNSIRIYPNPANDRLYIETQTLTIEIYDVYGRRQNLKNSETQKLRNSIDISELNSGIYFVKIKNEDGEVVKRFIKN